MAKVSWQEHFKASIKNAENLYSQDSTNVSLLLFCLRAKMIPVQTYLDWAKENYQLPVLSEKFFQIHPPEQEFYKKWQEIHPWSAECLPIAEWDGVLIIACLQIPENFQHISPTVFVLTSHEFLDSTWTVYQKSSRASEVDFADMTALAATVIATPKDANFFGDDGELILQEEAPKEEIFDETSENSAFKEGDSGSLEGLLGDNPAPSDSLTGFTKTVPISLQPMDTEVTKEIKITSQHTPPAMGTIEEPPVKKGPRSVQSLMTIKGEPVEGLSPLAMGAPEKKNISPATQFAAGTVEFPSAPVKPTTSHADKAAYLLEKIRKQDQDRFDKEALASFQQLKTFFKKSMLLAIGDKDRLVKPILWDGGIDIQKIQNPQQKSEFNLKTPSIFKIVTGTQKPYHGFVVINDLNESFFESWNHGQIPDHVTIVPLLDGDLVVGMLMGFGEKSSYNKNVLHFTENVAKDFSQRIFKRLVTKAA